MCISLGIASFSMAYRNCAEQLDAEASKTAQSCAVAWFLNFKI
jgi:hypothetical protein